MKVEEIYAKISQNIVDEIDSSWSVATINSYLGRGCGHFEGRATCSDFPYCRESIDLGPKWVMHNDDTNDDKPF